MALNRLALDAGLFRGLSAVEIDALMREIGAGMRGHATEFLPVVTNCYERRCLDLLYYGHK